MSSLTNKYVNNRSMNGLINIYADNIETTNSTVNDTLIVDGKDISLTVGQVETNKTNLTGITYISTPTPTTKIVNDIDETGTIYIRDTSNPSSVYMRIAYEPSLFGFCFTDETPGRIMNFRVKNANGIGYKLFYFASSQLYANMLAYIDNWLTVSYNNNIVLGDANNAGVWSGSAMKYIPNTADTSGLVFYNKGLSNNSIYYTNFTHNDPFNVQLYTFRMNYANIWSKVKHTFENSLIGQDATFATTLNVNGTSTLKAISGTSLTITGSSTFNSTIVADSLSVINGTNLNGNLNAISTSNFIGTATFTGSAVFNNTFNAGSGAFSGTLFVTSGLTCGSINCAGDIVSYGSITTNGSFPNTLTGSLVVNNTISTNNTFTQTGTTATTNRIIQPRISLDVTGSPNILKYTQIKFNSGSTTDKPALQLIDETGNLSLNFLPNAGSGSYGSLAQANDRLIIAVNNDGSASALDLSTFGPSGKHGIRINHASSIDYTTQIWANTYNFKVNSITGISATVGANSLVMNSTNTTITGPITFSNAITANSSTALNGNVLLGTTTLLNNNILQYGSSVVYQDITGTYSGTNQLKKTTFVETVTFSGSYIEFPGGITDRQTKAFNDTNTGYSLSGSTLTFPTNTIINCAVGGIGNEIKCHKFNCYNIIEFPDGSQQNTAYTSAKDTKLNAIGTIITSTLNATTTLTSGSFFNCGSMSLSAGTYMLTLNCCMSVISGSTTVSQLLTTVSTSSTSISSNSNLSIINGGSITYAVNNQWVLTTSAILSPTVTTTYYMICQAGFGTASRLQFASGNSSFQAVRIA